MGKSAGFGPVAGDGLRLPSVVNDLLGIRGPTTVGTCCTYGVLKPSWQDALFGVCFHLFPRHAIEQFVKVDMLASLYPLACRIDLAVRLDSSDHGGSRELLFRQMEGIKASWCSNVHHAVSHCRRRCNR
jgi:hypothetical protein